jgi:hypothetical protein
VSFGQYVLLILAIAAVLIALYWFVLLPLGERLENRRARRERAERDHLNGR